MPPEAPFSCLQIRPSTRQHEQSGEDEQQEQRGPGQAAVAFLETLEIEDVRKRRSRLTDIGLDLGSANSPIELTLRHVSARSFERGLPRLIRNGSTPVTIDDRRGRHELTVGRSHHDTQRRASDLGSQHGLQEHVRWQFVAVGVEVSNSSVCSIELGDDRIGKRVR